MTSRGTARAATPLELPLGEEILAARTDKDGVRYVVTSAGRKVAVHPDGAIVVLVGPPFGEPEPEEAPELEPDQEPEPASEPEDADA